MSLDIPQQHELFQSSNSDLINTPDINESYFIRLIENNTISGLAYTDTTDDSSEVDDDKIFPFLSNSIDHRNEDIKILKDIFHNIHQDIETFFDYLNEYNSELPDFSHIDIEQIKFAYFIAAVSHNTQMRKDNTTVYMKHPFRIAVLSTSLPLKKNESYTDRIIKALLHDTIEDTNIVRDFIKAIFGNKNAQSIDTLSQKELHLYIPQINLENEDSLTNAEKSQIHDINLIFANDFSIISTGDYDDETRHKKRIPAVRKLKNALSISDSLAMELKKILKRIRNKDYYGKVFKEDCIKTIDRAESFATMDDWAPIKIEAKIDETIKYVLPYLKLNSPISYNLIVLHINDLISKKTLPINMIEYMQLSDEEGKQVYSIFQKIKSIVRKDFISKAVEINGNVININQFTGDSQNATDTIVGDINGILEVQR